MTGKGIRWNRFMGAVVALLSAASPSQHASADEPRVIALQLTAAAMPEPALRYRLHPAIRDIQSGNAAALYYRGMLLLNQQHLVQPRGRLNELFDLPADKLPLEETRQVLAELRSVLHEVTLGTQRQPAVWDVPLREDGVATQLPEVQEARTIGRALVLRARMEALEGNFSASVESLRTALVLARHVGESGTLISSLVGLSIVNSVADEIERQATMPGSPNLYWALTALPDPLVDLKAGLESEQLWLSGTLPHLDILATSILSPQQAGELAEALSTLAADTPRPAAIAEGLAFSSAAFLFRPALSGYSASKQQLIAQGLDPALVEAMPIVQVLCLRWVQVYYDLLDAELALAGRPYAEVRDAWKESQSAQQDLQRAPQAFLARQFLPAMGAAQTAFVRQEQRFALLRVVSALRVYASEHEGRLPGRLAEIDGLAIPQDPAAGRPFDYRLEGDRAIIRPEDLYDEVRYEITIRR